MNIDRTGHLTTFTGRKFYPFDPQRDPDAICARDIAHALSMMCRYGGHCRRFYSVAEHSWHLADHLFRAAKLPSDMRSQPRRLILEWALQALLHDGAEAYIADIVRPIKRGLPEYNAVESKIATAIMLRFRLPAELPAYIIEIDNRILLDEVQQNMRDTTCASFDTKGLEPLGVRLQFWHPETAENKFLGMFYNIMEEMHR